jgi:taurine--2-oxoglutarate transaminase
MEDERLVERSAQMGEIMASHLARMKAAHPSVGDVRSIGLFGVIELVKDRDTREPLAPWNAAAAQMGPMNKVAARLRELGLHTFVRWNWIFTVPPLVISEEDLAKGFEWIDDALRIADQAVEK